jgi:hypothetical protein
LRLSVFEVADQYAALNQLIQLVERASVHPTIREAAIAIVQECNDRDDVCELEAIYEAVKHGTRHVPALRQGVKYLADPRWADHFTAPWRLLEQCRRGICAADCDDHAMLIASLASAIGFQTGLRVWGRKRNDYVHVYAVAKLSKRKPKEVVGLDTTVDEASVGWEPPGGYTYTVWSE